MKKLITLILLLFFISCHFIGLGNGINFKIKNNTEFHIYNVKFYTSEKLEIAEFDIIESHKSVS